VLETIRSFFAPPISAEEQGRARLAWVVRLRWIALLAQLGSIPPALAFGLLEAHLLAPFAAVIGALALLNVLTWLALRRGADRADGLGARPGTMLFQLSADAVALSTLLALTGGAWNPVAPILFVHAVLGSLLLEGRLSVVFFALLVACLVGIQTLPVIPSGLEGSLVPARILFPAQLLFALVLWIVTAWLSRTLSALQGHFAGVRERKTRIDRLRAVGALAAGLSHEFATPLNTAQLKLRRLARRHGLDDDDDVATAAEALQRCGEVLRHMAGSQLQPEGLALDPVDVDGLVGQVCSSVTQANPRARLRFVKTGRSPRRALLPAVAFSQALLNLIDNALKSGGEDGEVEVIVGTRPGVVEVSVLDRGDGWPAVVRRHLGEPFVTTRPDGVGLGLYYVHTLVEALGAELVLEDRSSGGARARIALPAVAPSSSRSAHTHEESAPAGGAEAAEATG